MNPSLLGSEMLVTQAAGCKRAALERPVHKPVSCRTMTESALSTGIHEVVSDRLHVCTRVRRLVITCVVDK